MPGLVPHGSARLRRTAIVSTIVVLASVVLAGGALAAWNTSGGGTATARGGTLVAPTSLAAGTQTCPARGQTQVPFTWSAVPEAMTYFGEVASNAAFTQNLQSVTVTTNSTTATLASATYTTAYVRITARAGNWSGPRSATLTTTVRRC